MIKVRVMPTVVVMAVVRRDPGRPER
jgi:hypothetical protein